MESEEREVAQALTVGEALLAVIVLASAVWRLVDLDALPLSAAEATEALAVFNFWSTDTPSSIGSPGWFALTAIIRPLVGINDSAMRLIPALFGIATLTLPWFLRHRIGSVGAIVASTLIALSPTHLMISRTAGGDSLAVFAALLLFVAWVTYRDFGGRWRFLTMAVALAFGLLSSSLFYTFLVAIAGVWLLSRLSGSNRDSIPSAWWRTAAIILAAIVIGVGTIVMIAPAGLGAVGNQVANWVGQFGFGNGWSVPLQTLLYETPLLLFGMIALAFALVRGGEMGSWLTYIALIGLLMTLFQEGIVENIVVITIPVYLMVGLLFNRLFSQAPDWRVWVVTAMVVGWGMLALVNVGRYTRVNADNVAPLIVTILFFLLVSLITFAIVTNSLQGLQGIALGLLSVCIFFSMGTGWTLAHETGNHPREAWTTSGTDNDIRLMRDTLAEASYQLVKADDELEIVSTIDTPAMRWYLRDFVDVEYVSGVAPNMANVAVIAEESAEPSLADGYASATFDIAQTGEQSQEAFDFTSELKWRFFKENKRELMRDRATVWLYLLEE